MYLLNETLITDTTDFLIDTSYVDSFETINLAAIKYLKSPFSDITILRIKTKNAKKEQEIQIQ